MMTVRWEVRDSAIAGQGVFTLEDIPAGRVVFMYSIGPHDMVVREDALPDIFRLHPELQGNSSRVAGDYYILHPNGMSDECKVNHSIDYNIFNFLHVGIAIKDIQAGEELTMDYRHLMSPDCPEMLDGHAVRGLPNDITWEEFKRRVGPLLERKSAPP